VKRKRDRWDQQLLARVGGFALSAIVRPWMSTLRYQAWYETPHCDPAAADYCGRAVLITWHEYLPIFLYLRGHCDVALLVSKHRDAEFLARIAKLWGFDAVRGSTARGGAKALRKLLRDRSRTSLGIAPDGPRGPRRELAPGCIYLASRLGLPIIMGGFGYDRPWRNQRSWDKFAVPRLGSEARLVISRRYWVDPDADRPALECHRQVVEHRLNELTGLAERWAAGGQPPAGGTVRVVHRQPRTLERDRWNSSEAHTDGGRTVDSPAR
jgi:lysophospholipid acyltransferase (LPLAT)-like uncharacterized protein